MLFIYPALMKPEALFGLIFLAHAVNHASMLQNVEARSSSHEGWGTTQPALVQFEATDRKPGSYLAATPAEDGIAATRFRSRKAQASPNPPKPSEIHCDVFSGPPKGFGCSW